MPTTEKTQIIVRDFSREENTDNEKWSLEELEEAIADLGWRDVNSGQRIRIQNRIEVLKNTEARSEQRSYESKVRVWNIVVGIIMGLAIAGIANLLF